MEVSTNSLASPPMQLQFEIKEDDPLADALEARASKVPLHLAEQVGGIPFTWESLSHLLTGNPLMLVDIEVDRLRRVVTFILKDVDPSPPRVEGSEILTLDDTVLTPAIRSLLR